MWTVVNRSHAIALMLAVFTLVAVAGMGRLATQPATTRSAHSAAGKWDLNVKASGLTMSIDLYLAQDGANITGKAQGAEVKGTVDGDRIEFKVALDTDPKEPRFLTYTGKFADADHMTGTVDFGGVKTDFGELGKCDWGAGRLAGK